MIGMLKSVTIPSYALNSNCNTITSNCNFFRPEMVVGWYHSHPGFGCWLSGVDINTQQVLNPLDPHKCFFFFFLLEQNKTIQKKTRHLSGLAFLVRKCNKFLL